MSEAMTLTVKHLHTARPKGLEMSNNHDGKIWTVVMLTITSFIGKKDFFCSTDTSTLDVPSSPLW